MVSVPVSRTLQLTDIAGLSISRHKDNFAVVHHKDAGRDLVISVGGLTQSHGAWWAHRERSSHSTLFSLTPPPLLHSTVTEFVSRFYLAAREAGNKIEVKVVDSITYNNTQKPGTEKLLRFKPNPAGVPGFSFSGGYVLYA